MTRLLDLPDDLLIEIIKELKWIDVLNIRQTCQRLNLLSRTYPVWRYLVEGVQHTSVYPETPLETYSANELESLFLQRKRADAGFEEMTWGDQPHGHFLPVSPSDIYGGASPFKAELVPGGRWLLVATTSGSVIYYDLDSVAEEAGNPRFLLPQKGRDFVTKINIDMDLTSLVLKFNLAVYSFDMDPCSGVLEVWQVDLVLDDRGRGTGLQATQLASFEQEPQGSCGNSIWILGEQLLFSSYYRRHMTTYAFLINWRSVRGPGYDKRVIYSHGNPSARLVQRDVLLYTDRNLISVVFANSLPKIIEMPATPEEIPPVEPFTTMTSNQIIENVSRRQVYGDSIRFLLHGGTDITGVTLTNITQSKRSRGCSITMVMVAEIQPGNQLLIPFQEDYFLAWCEIGELHMYRFSWSGTAAEDATMALVDKRSERFSLYLFDISSGRILVNDKLGKGISVLDIATLPLAQ